LWRPLAMPTELERSGMAFGEVGFSPTICVVAVRLRNYENWIIEVCGKCAIRRTLGTRWKILVLKGYSVG
jgi:hypothetical protein